MNHLRPPRKGFTLVELLVVLGILAALVGLLLPAVMKVRSAADRLRCSANMRQVGLALSNYHSTRGQLPPGMRDGPGEPFPYMSWLARILPYAEQDAVWKQAVAAYGVTKTPTADPPHPFSTVIRLYGCPADERVKTATMTRGKYTAAFTSYLGVSGKTGSTRDGILYLDSTVRFTDITDGTSNTILVGERPPSKDLWYGWWYAGFGAGGNGTADMVLGVRENIPPGDAFIPDCGGLPARFAPGRIDNMCDVFHFWSLHPGGANFLFADGSVRFLAYSADAIMPALATRSGGEVVELP